MANEGFTKLRNGLYMDNKTKKIGYLQPTGRGGYYVEDISKLPNKIKREDKPFKSYKSWAEIEKEYKQKRKEVVNTRQEAFRTMRKTREKYGELSTQYKNAQENYFERSRELAQVDANKRLDMNKSTNTSMNLSSQFGMEIKENQLNNLKTAGRKTMAQTIDNFNEKEYDKRFRGGADYRYAQSQIDKERIGRSNIKYETPMQEEARLNRTEAVEWAREIKASKKSSQEYANKLKEADRISKGMTPEEYKKGKYNFEDREFKASLGEVDIPDNFEAQFNEFANKMDTNTGAKDYYSKLSQYQAREDLDMRKVWLDDNIYSEDKRKEYEDFYNEGEKYYQEKYNDTSPMSEYSDTTGTGYSDKQTKALQSGAYDKRTSTELRKQLKSLEPYTQELQVGNRVIVNTGGGRYGVRNKDDYDDPMTDYSAYVYGFNAKSIIERAREQGIVIDKPTTKKVNTEAKIERFKERKSSPYNKMSKRQLAEKIVEDQQSRGMNFNNKEDIIKSKMKMSKSDLLKYFK